MGVTVVILNRMSRWALLKILHLRKDFTERRELAIQIFFSEGSGGGRGKEDPEGAHIS